MVRTFRKQTKIELFIIRVTFFWKNQTWETLYHGSKIESLFQSNQNNTQAMNLFRKFKITFVALAVATLGLQSCSNLSPGQNGALGALGGGILGAGIAALSGGDEGDIVAAALAGAVVGGVVVYQYEKQKASKRQLSVALKRAQEYEAKKDREWKAYEQKKAAAEARRKSIAKSRTLTSSQKQTAAKKIVVPKKPKKKSRYVAVKTERTSASTGTASTVFYDTQKNAIADSNAYDLKKTPKQGELVKVGSYKAEYY